MNKTIILSDLSSNIASLTGCSAAEAEAFVRELSNLVAERLDSDGQVEVPGLGTFVVTDETVAFAPVRELAEEINAPFSAFEAVELPDEVEENAVDESAAEIAAAAEFEQESLAEESAPESERPQAAEPELPHDPEPAVKIPEYRPTPKPPAQPEPAVVEKKRPLTWPWWLIGCIVCFIAGYILGSGPETQVLEPESEIPEGSETLVPSEEIDFEDFTAVCEEPVEILVAAPDPQLTDTITSLNFLTTMARKYYGHVDFWPYIYEANASKLGHPDRLAAGIVVVIPPADSLHLDAKDPEQLKLAKQKATEIYQRFNGR